MAIALNKTALKQQRDQAKTYRQYLPSLELKRQQLLAALKAETVRRDELREQLREHHRRVESLFSLLGSSTVATSQLTELIRLCEVNVEEENVLGTSLPVVRQMRCEVADFSKWVTPFWVDHLVAALERIVQLRVRLGVADQRVERFEHATRRITQRVNLFEKVLIPRAEENIRRIVIFLSDQERAAVVRSKIAKGKKTSPLAD